MNEKAPTYEIPQRTIIMKNGKPCLFSFDNACIDHLEQNYGGNATTLEMLHSLTAYQQEVLDGEKVDYLKFKYELMPPLVDPKIKACVDGLMAEIKEKQQRAKATLTGNENPTPTASPASHQENASSDAAISGESSSG